MPQPTRSLNLRSEQAGLLSAAAAAPLAYQRTLMPRSTADQALISGLAVATNYAVTTTIQDALQSLALLIGGQGDTDDPEEGRWGAAAIGVDAAALVAGLAVQRALPNEHREPLPRAGVRSAGYWLARSASVGLIVGALQGSRRGAARFPVAIPAAATLAAVSEVRRRRAARADIDLPPTANVSRAKATALGLGVVAGTSGLGVAERALASTVGNVAARVLPGSATLWRPVGHVASLAAFGAGGRAAAQQVFRKLERVQESFEAALDLPPPLPLLSGSLESHVPFETLARAGRRFVWNVTMPNRIEEVMGEPALQHASRLYVGLESADDETARVELAMRELDRVGAWDRSWLMVAMPTGTGYVNYVAVTALEMLSRGDCATIAMQYAARPSPVSLDRVGEGRNHARLLLDAIGARLADMPVDRRPKLVLFGESLGAWTSQDAFIGRGTKGLVDTGVDHGIWIGTPHMSKWKEQVLFDSGPEIDRSLLGVFNDIGEWRALSSEERSRIRYVMVTHYDDGVSIFGPELAIQAPSWLGPPEDRPASIPRSMRWMPSTTFFQALVDMKNAAQVVPGVLAAKGHDYRADLLPFFIETLGFEADAGQVDRITEFLMFQELRRSRWMETHATVGRSLSATLARRWMEQETAAGRDPSVVLLEAFGALLDELDQVADDEQLATKP